MHTICLQDFSVGFNYTCIVREFNAKTDGPALRHNETPKTLTKDDQLATRILINTVCLANKATVVSYETIKSRVSVHDAFLSSFYQRRKHTDLYALSYNYSTILHRRTSAKKPFLHICSHMH